MFSFAENVNLYLYRQAPLLLGRWQYLQIISLRVYLEKCLQGEADVILRNGQIANYHQPSTKEYILVSLLVSTAISYHQMLLNLTHGAFN